jgi:hypothetical protein
MWLSSAAMVALGRCGAANAFRFGVFRALSQRSTLGLEPGRFSGQSDDIDRDHLD